MAKRYRPTPLLKQHVGREICGTWRGPNGGDLKLCVRGSKYGFTGWLHGKGGVPPLPVPIDAARTPQQAMTEAKKFLDRIATKRN